MGSEKKMLAEWICDTPAAKEIQISENGKVKTRGKWFSDRVLQHCGRTGTFSKTNEAGLYEFRITQ